MQAKQKEKRGCVGGWEAGMAVREVGEVVCYLSYGDCDPCFPPSSAANVSDSVTLNRSSQLVRLR